ncbi:hypothetical protein OG474_09735 [Kribbella sp. NBC_01505]|uniref:hypothetical protein n=1 Tax=Kribbella sp. NBC_01505 TaxID=2903580 RepID=UPI0038661928
MTTRQTIQHNTGQTFPIAGVLGVAFVVLKLVGVIHWSWWLVLLPFYGPTLAVLAVVGAIALVAGLFYAASHVVGRRG